jgi:hypothetical protein
MKEKITNAISIVFGYGIMLSLFIGGLTFFGYIAALIIGGNTADMICTFIYKTIYPYLVYFTSIIVLLGLLKMYICGETALDAKK